MHENGRIVIAGRSNNATLDCFYFPDHIIPIEHLTDGGTDKRKKKKENQQSVAHRACN
jgi:hypothetical protein